MTNRPLIVAFVLIVIGISRELSAITGSTSPSPRTASISALHVGVSLTADALGLPRPSYSGLQDGPQATISSMSAWTLNHVARCAGLCCGAPGLAPKNARVLPRPPPSMGPLDYSTCVHIRLRLPVPHLIGGEPRSCGASGNSRSNNRRFAC